MEKGNDLVQTQCLNCNASLEGDFCHECSQPVRDNSDRSLGRLLGVVFSNFFFVDNRFLISMWYLIRFPSRMTVEFLEGKRKKFISPVTLFLFLNLIYFIVNPLTDYSISLYDQIHSQFYSDWTLEWIKLKLQNEGLNFQEYSITYQNASDNISKSMMIINIPIIALFIYLMSFKKRRYYFDSLIFAFHFFTLFMFSLVMLDWVGLLLDFLIGDEDSIVYSIFFILYLFIVPLLYAILGIKKFIGINWYWAIPAGIGVFVSVIATNLLYRFIIFTLAFWST